MGFAVDKWFWNKCVNCGTMYYTNWVGWNVCTDECDETHKNARLGKPCASCGEKVRRGIYNVFGGEIELDICGCEGSGEF